MLRFLDTQFSNKKTIFQVLSEILGIGLFQAQRICRRFGLKSNLYWNVLSNRQKSFLVEYLLKEKKELKDSVLAQHNSERRKFLASVRCFRGIRLTSGLPVRGQRTRTNKKTAKKLNR